MKNEQWIPIFCYNTILFYFQPELEWLVLNKLLYTFFLFLFFNLLLFRSNCAENIRKHILHTGKHEGVKMYNCPKCDYGTNIPVEFRNHLKELHPDIENPDLAYLHAGKVILPFAFKFFTFPGEHAEMIAIRKLAVMLLSFILKKNMILKWA